MKKSIIFLFLIISIITLDAGKTKGKVIKVDHKSPMVSISLNGNGGTALSSGVSNAISFNPNVGVEVGWGNFGLGIDAGTFNTLSNFDFDTYAAPLRDLDFLTVTGSNSNWRSTSFAFGPSYSFSLRSVKPISGVGIVVKHNYPKATVRLSVKGGVTMNQAPDFSIMNLVTRKDIAAYSPPTDFKKNALTLIPSIRLNYWLSQSIALSANVQYAMQSGQTAFTTGYKDLSNVAISPTISPDQFSKNISTAPNITSTTVGPDKYLSVGAGLIISFGKKGINQAGIKKNEAESKAITQSGIKRTEYNTNTTSMIVPETGTVKQKNDLKVSVMGSGETEANGTPIIDGKTVSGSLSSNITKNNAFVEVKISQTESGDIGTAITDEKGNFSIDLNHDTLHTIALNGVEFGKIKLTESKGWDGSVKGNNIQTKHAISTKGTGGTKLSSGVISETGNADPNEQSKKGIQENGLKKNEAEYVLADAEVKAIAETLVNLRKGWDGTVKGGSIAEKKGIQENGLKNNEAKSENINLKHSTTAYTLVNLARKGWDGSVKGNNVAYEPIENELETVTETLETIRKGWDGSIKGNKTDYVANDADVKAIAQTMVNLRKGWDGSVKGNKKGITQSGIKKNGTPSEGIIDNGRRISLKVSTPKQTQGATFGEKVNAGKINVEVIEDGCIIQFPNDGLLINTKKMSSKQLTSNQQKEFGERMNAGLPAAGGALSQGASLLGGALPGGAVISAAVSSFSTTTDSNETASSAKTTDKKKKKVWDSSRDDNCDGMMNLPDGEYEFEFIIEQKAPSGIKQTLQTQVLVVFTSINNVLKTKHDTVKNSINNVR